MNAADKALMQALTTEKVVERGGTWAPLSMAEARHVVRLVHRARSEKGDGRGRWAHCSPALLASGVDCAETPRRACECPGGGSHDHYVSDATCRHHAARLPAPSYLAQESGHAPDPRSI